MILRILKFEKKTAHFFVGKLLWLWKTPGDSFIASPRTHSWIAKRPWDHWSANRPVESQGPRLNHALEVSEVMVKITNPAVVGVIFGGISNKVVNWWFGAPWFGIPANMKRIGILRSTPTFPNHQFATCWWFERNPFIHPWKLTCPLKRNYFSREYSWTNHWFSGAFVRFQGKKTCW